MKDLKHIYYFEKLLEDAKNELVRKAQDEGKLCIANVCSFTPEVLMELPGCFSVRLRAPRTGSMEMGTYYLTSFLCEYTRALLERAIEGGYQFIDALIAPDGCSMMNRCVENIELLKTCTKEKFFVKNLEIPMKNDENGLAILVAQSQQKILNPLHDVYGIDTSDEALLKAVELHNKVCNLIMRIGEYRKEDNPRITGYEFQIITLCTFVAPKEELIKKLEETLEELKTREKDTKNHYRARVVVAGSEIDDVDFIKLVEDSGALVVADRYCYGSFPDRLPIELDGNGTVLEQICRHYLTHNQCARLMDMKTSENRRVYIDQLAKDFHADGIILQQMKFCDCWAYEKMVATKVLRDEYNHPVLAIDRPYAVGNSGQIRTRVQAFVESIEIKKIQGGKK